MQKSITLTIIAATLALSAPVDAQAQKQVTMEEGAECMVASIPFLMQAVRYNPEAADEIAAGAEFWADYADSFGEPSDAHMDKVDAETEAMLAQFETIKTEAEMDAFVAPYQARFDACEEIRKAMQAG